MRKGNQIPEIEIIADVLSYLPSISLLRFKLACKTWYSLISDPDFINLQSKRASPNPKILFSTGSHLHLLDYESSSFGRSSVLGPLNSDEGISPLKIVGSIFGLICVATKHNRGDFRIWNPITKECKKVPNFAHLDHEDYLHGLGYDSVTNDLKLVIWVSRNISIFSLKSNSWKGGRCPLEYAVTITAWPWTKPPTTLATVSNGFLHWLVTPNSNFREIVVFDLAKEEFHKLQMPSFGSRSGSVVSLLEHTGCLCVSFSDFGSNVREIWMMKEYGDPTSWIHFLTISDYPRLNNFWQVPALCISWRNETVLQTDDLFIRYREEEGKFDEICMNGSRINGATLYVDTFISPYDINDKEDVLQQGLLPRKQN